jgi:hypothetical protein
VNNSPQQEKLITQNTKPTTSYSESLKKTAELKATCTKIDKVEAGKTFSKFIHDELFPHWYGTPWDFNGVTQTPGKGYIACGYFATTVLRDAGVKINRVKMAQCASEEMINSLTSKKENVSSLTFEKFIAYIKSKGEGLSVIGLDNHTGFLYNDGKQLYFIHSTFLGTKDVQKDIASNSIILQSSKYKVVGFISKDEHFLKKWMGG